MKPALLKALLRVVVVPSPQLPVSGTGIDPVEVFLSRNKSEWKLLLSQFGDLRINCLISSPTQNRIDEIVTLIRKSNKTYRRPAFADCFIVEAAAGIDGRALARQFKQWGDVNEAYVYSESDHPDVVIPNQANEYDPYCDEQYYLRPARLGIGIKAVWANANGNGCAGADGNGAALVDMENGFNPDHEDLAAHFQPQGTNPKIPITGINDPTEAYHGTAVLGIICARNNRVGCCGIVPNLSAVSLASTLVAGQAGCRERARCDVLVDAIHHLRSRPGGVILIEHQLLGTPEIPYGTPVELGLDDYEAIQFACDAGCIVIEPAGNGGADLDHDVRPPSPDINGVPSGAIMVAASGIETDGKPGYWLGGCDYCHVPLSIDGAKTTIGSRVDCFAPGENLRTCGATPNYDTTPTSFRNDEYCNDFGCTSGASAIIAGVALSIQGMVLARYGTTLKPDGMRWLLTNSQFCTTSKNGPSDRIGVMPDLDMIERALQNLNQSPLNWLLT
jgi:hypothetical protein